VHLEAQKTKAEQFLRDAKTKLKNKIANVTVPIDKPSGTSNASNSA
jgi:hypothetical protein